MDDICDDPRCERNRKGERHSIHDLNDQEQKHYESIKHLIDWGSDLAGTLSNTTISTSTADPLAILGGITATAIAHTIKYIGHEISQRHLSIREKKRIGAVYYFAIEKIKYKIKIGERLRQDDFFDDKDKRSAAEEILEGILLTAQKEYQEKKLRYYANLLANIAFHPEIDRAYANLLLKQAEDLTYRQLCILSVIGQRESYHLREENYRDGTSSISLTSLLIEAFELYSRGMLNGSGEAHLSAADIKPAKLKIQATGGMLYSLMELWEIDDEVLQQVIKCLQ